ncbi:MAG: DUF3298 domain-containing protein [Calditrichaeota bacterium]|nr:MAG: DUF3298 domain-containing protein [Calditrichota bacterium]
MGTFPVFLDKNEPLTILSQAIRDSVETRVNNFLMLGKEYLTPDAPLYELGWDQSIECRIHFFSPELISLLISISEYTGGAHGNLRFRTLNYTSIERNFRELTLNELFLPNSNYVDILSRLCVNDLKIQGASLITSQQVKTFSESDFSEFTINPAGLTIYFAPYEVGAYAEGPYQVFIPFNLLKDVIDWNGPLGVFKHLYKITNSGS